MLLSLAGARICTVGNKYIMGQDLYYKTKLSRTTIQNVSKTVFEELYNSKKLHFFTSFNTSCTFINIIESQCRGNETVLGMENGNVEDSKITSSTAWSNLPSTKARLNSDSSWSAGTNDKNQWIQVDLDKAVTVTKIATQGRKNYDQWVKTFTLSYSFDGENFEPYQVNGVEKVRDFYKLSCGSSVLINRIE